MKRNLEQAVTKIDGTDFPERVTLGAVCFAAATAPLPEDERKGLEEKMALYRLASRISVGGEMDMSAEDLVLLKDRIGKSIKFIELIGRTIDLLEAP